MRILAIDSGNVSGVAWWHDHAISSLEVTGGLWGLVAYCEDEMRLLLTHQRPELIVVEDFIINSKTHTKTREPAAYEGVGYVKSLAQRYDTPCLTVGAGEHKSLSGVNGPQKRNKIRRLGWHTESDDLHADDACSLVLLALKRYDWKTAEALLKEIAQ